MIKSIADLNTNQPIVDPANGFVTDTFRLYLLQVTARALLIGTGSPSGVVEAVQGTEYLDETGAAGSVKWIKQVSDVAGDRTLGWVAIG